MNKHMISTDALCTICLIVFTIIFLMLVGQASYAVQGVISVIVFVLGGLALSRVTDHNEE